MLNVLGAEMCKGNIIKILHRHKLEKMHSKLSLFTVTNAGGVSRVSPLNEQPCRMRWRGGEEALQNVNKTRGVKIY